jgi:hypothetical protein
MGKEHLKTIKTLFKNSIIYYKLENFQKSLELNQMVYE